jgi:uncharacterized membrane protein YqiK
MTSNFYEDYKDKVVGVATVAALAGGAVWLLTRYRVANPNQVFAVVGPLVNTASGIRVARRTFLLPYQKATVVNLDVSWLDVHLEGALSKDKIHVDSPFKIAFRPKEKDIIKYVQAFSGLGQAQIRQDLTEQATCDLRELVATLDIDDLFNNQAATREALLSKLTAQWDTYGLEVIDCVPQKVGDPRGKEGYFHFQSLRAMERSRAEGGIGTAEQQRRSRVQIAAHESEAVQAEQNNLVLQKTATATATKRILEAQQAVQLMQIAQERARAEQALEAEAAKLRSKDMAATTVDMEVQLAKAQNEAARIKTIADARFYEADRKAAANKVRLLAEAEGLHHVVQASGGSLPDYIRMKLAEGTSLHDLLKASADGMKGMNPKISILATGPDAAGRAVESMNHTGMALASALTTVESALGVKILPNVIVPEGSVPKRRTENE